MTPIATSAAPKVSLILPVYNGEQFLATALDSILAQTMTDFEVIAVNDASRDGSAAILADYAARDPRIRVITKEVNAGLPAALNTGFAAARGRYHSWTSDDNLLRPPMLERLAGVLDAEPEADIVHSGFIIVEADGTTLVERIHVGPIEELLIQNNVGASFMYRAAVTEALGGYDEGLFGAEDYDFWLRAARRFLYRAIPDDLYIYRRHGGSLTNTRAAQIHSYVARIVVRDLDLEPTPAGRARVLIGLATRNLHDARFDLLRRAFAESPSTVLKAGPGILRWMIAVGKRRVIG